VTLGPKTLTAFAGLLATVYALGATHAGSSIEKKLDKVLETQVEQGKVVAKIESDVRLLKCAADVPGECPGQAKRR